MLCSMKFSAKAPCWYDHVTGVAEIGTQHDIVSEWHRRGAGYGEFVGRGFL